MGHPVSTVETRSRIRRGRWLCACASAALVAQTAFAAPITGLPDRDLKPIVLTIVPPSPTTAVPPVQQKPTSGSTDEPGLILPNRGPKVDRPAQDPLEGVGTLSPKQLTVDRGAFDISVETPDGAPAGKGATLPPSLLPGPTERVPPPPSVVDTMLVSGRAAPPADQARVEGGAVVLMASPNAASASGNSGNGNGAGNGNGPPVDVGPPPPPPPPPPASDNSGADNGVGNGGQNKVV